MRTETTYLSSGSGSVKDEERVLRADNLRSAVRLNLVVLLVPPLIPTLDPLDISSSPLQNQAVLDQRALSKSGIDDGLGGDGLSSSLSFVGSDNNSRLGVLDTITERFGGETGEDDGVDSS